MINTYEAGLLNQASWPAAKAQLGTKLAHTPSCAHGVYDYTKDGGAVGDINLKDIERKIIKIPAHAVVTNVFYFVETAATGLTSFDVNLEAANDLIAAASTFTANAKVLGIPDWATAADYVVTTAERTLTFSINGTAATAGKIHVFVFYVF